MSKFTIILVAIGVISTCFGCLVFAADKKDNKINNKNDPKEIYNGLRDMALQASPAQLSINVQNSVTPYGVLMETGYPEGIVTLVVMGDGAVSMYFNNGGGMIGGGEHANIRVAGEKFIKESAKYISKMNKVTNFPTPSLEQTRFYVLTTSGIYSVERKEKDLGEGSDALSPLFYAEQEVFTQFRESKLLN